MAKAHKHFRLSDETLSKIKNILSMQNEIREGDGLPPLTETEIVENAIGYYYLHIVKNESLNKEIEKDRETLISSVNELFEDKFSSIMQSIEFLKSQSKDNSEWIRLIMAGSGYLDSIKGNVQSMYKVSNILNTDLEVKKILIRDANVLKDND